MPLKVQNQNPAVMWKRIVAQLKREMKGYRAGDRFYSLKAIIAKFNVSAITARRVLSELAREDLVALKPGRGVTLLKVHQALRLWFVTFENEPLREAITSPVMLRLYIGAYSQAHVMNVPLAVITGNRLPQTNFSNAEKHGFMIIESHYWDGPATRRFFAQHRYPFVLLNAVRRRKDVVCVGWNRKKAGYDLTRYLMDLGHRRIAFVGLDGNISIRGRFNGYVKALVEKAQGPDPRLVKAALPSDTTALSHALDELWALPQRPTVLICANDFIAMNVLKICDKRGIRVPADVGVVGFDNVEEAALLKPALTTMNTHLEIIGGKAVEILVHKLQDPKWRWGNETIAPELVLRESVIPPVVTGRGNRPSLGQTLNRDGEAVARVIRAALEDGGQGI